MERKIPTKPCNCPDPIPGNFDGVDICEKCWGLNPRVPEKKTPKKKTTKKAAKEPPKKEVDSKVT